MVFTKMGKDYEEVSRQLDMKVVTYIPISALNCDNIVDASVNMDWFEGKPLLQFLEDVQLDNDINYADSRFQVQLVIRPQTEELHDYRGYAGKISSGVYRKGDTIIVLPAGHETTISKIEVGGQEVEEAFAPQPVVFQLAEDLDISRGDTFAKPGNLPETGSELDVLLCWLGDKPLQPGNKYYLQHNSRLVRSVIKSVAYKLDVNTLQQQPVEDGVKLNEVVRAVIKTASPLAYDAYAKLNVNGSAILIDETSNSTVAAVLFQ